MIIRLKKARDGDSTLTFVRDDGSSTWRHVSSYFAQHDLWHYAVESTLGLERAFFGLLAAGRDLDEFDDRASAWLPSEAVVAEVIIGQLQAEQAGSARPDDLQDRVRAGCEGLGLDAPSISSDDAASARTLHGDLLARWSATPPGGTLELEWPATVARRTGDAERATSRTSRRN